MTNLQALILAVGIAVAGIGYAVAQVSTKIAPSNISGCVVYSSPPTFSDGQSTVLTCDTTGKLRVTTS